MTDFNFNQIIKRRHSNSIKWDSAPEEGILPMWVADMDFKAAPCIIEALRKRVDHGVFGYTHVPEEYYDAIVSWFAGRHNWTIPREMILYTTGVVPAIIFIIRALTSPGDKVIIQPPVYNAFFHAIPNAGCEILENPLIYSDGTYTMNLDDLEAKASDPDAKLLLLSNPHNPAGRVWSADELEQLNNICLRHNVTVISDEIHCELTFPGHSYTPFASISEDCRRNAVVCNSPSKAFNIAGLQIANIVCPDSRVRDRIDMAIRTNEACNVNPFGVEALIAAYTKGEEWLDALNAYIYHNYLILKEYFAKHLPELNVIKMEGTYLAWIDCRRLGIDSDSLQERLIRTEKLWINSGAMYGGNQFMRINIACPTSVMTEGLERLRRFVSTL